MPGVRPVTPGTVVVAAGTTLLILASISVPILKQFYFLSATFPTSGGNNPGTLLLGVWGYCISSTCSTASLGYTLDAQKIFGISGYAAEIPAAIPNTLIKWLTYTLVLHPIAAAFGFVATIFGILSHIREFSVTGFTTCFASIGAFFALLAFVFDIVLFQIAVQRINQTGGQAKLGLAVWFTLAGMLCLSFSGCFFGLGRCLIRNRRNDADPNTDLKGNTMPILPDNYGNKTLLHQEEEPSSVPPGGYGQGNMYKSSSMGTGGLPIFQDRDGEIIPLNSMRHSEDFNREDQMNYNNGNYVPQSSSLVSGVGLGYGRRKNDQNGIVFSPSSNSAYAAPGAAGLGAGGAGGFLVANGVRNQQDQDDRRLGSNSTTIEPFVGMHNQSLAPSDSSNYGRDYIAGPISSLPEAQPYPYQGDYQQRAISPTNNQYNNVNDNYYNSSYPTSSQAPSPSNSQGVEQLATYYTVPSSQLHPPPPASMISQSSYGQQSQDGSNTYNTAPFGPPTTPSSLSSRYANSITSPPQQQQYFPPSSPPIQHYIPYPMPSHTSSPSPPPLLSQSPPPQSSTAAPSYYSSPSSPPPQQGRAVYSPEPGNNRTYQPPSSAQIYGQRGSVGVDQSSIASGRGTSGVRNTGVRNNSASDSYGNPKDEYSPPAQRRY